MAATLLKQGRLETALVGRGLEGFQQRVEVELQPSGVMELDAVLGGGFPRGSLVELCGPASSGRTSLAFSLLAQATERQEACAFVDPTQGFRLVPVQVRSMAALILPLISNKNGAVYDSTVGR
jgi:RecA/RadA recombinase